MKKTLLLISAVLIMGIGAVLAHVSNNINKAQNSEKFDPVLHKSITHVKSDLSGMD